MSSSSSSYSVSNLKGDEGITFQSSGCNSADTHNIGDVNNDGKQDIAIAARSIRNSVIVLFGTRASFSVPLTPEDMTGRNGFIIQGENDGGEHGWSASALGDINNDGTDDFLVASDSTVYVIHGRDTFTKNLNLASIDGQSGSTFTLSSTSDSFATARGIGDVNGDGKGDITLGTICKDQTAYCVYVLYAPAHSYLAFAAAITLAPDQFPGAENKGFLITLDTDTPTGISLGGTGDVTGDGFDELVVVPDLQDTAYLIFGSKDAPSSPVVLSSLDAESGCMIQGIHNPLGDFRFFMSKEGDVNGDGVKDLIIGDSKFQNNQGRVAFIFGGSDAFSHAIDLNTLDGQNGFVITGDKEGDMLGASMDHLNINSDRYGDVVVGAPNVAEQGAAYVFPGHKAPFPPSIAASSFPHVIQWAGAEAGAWTGSSASHTDFDGDGKPDVVISAEKVGFSYIALGKSIPPLHCASFWHHFTKTARPEMAPWHKNLHSAALMGKYGVHMGAVVTAEAAGVGKFFSSKNTSSEIHGDEALVAGGLAVLGGGMAGAWIGGKIEGKIGGKAGEAAYYLSTLLTAALLAKGSYSAYTTGHLKEDSAVIDMHARELYAYFDEHYSLVPIIAGAAAGWAEGGGIGLITGGVAGRQASLVVHYFNGTTEQEIAGSMVASFFLACYAKHTLPIPLWPAQTLPALLPAGGYDPVALGTVQNNHLATQQAVWGATKQLFFTLFGTLFVDFLPEQCQGVILAATSGALAEVSFVQFPAAGAQATPMPAKGAIKGVLSYLAYKTIETGLACYANTEQCKQDLFFWYQTGWDESEIIWDNIHTAAQGFVKDHFVLIESTLGVIETAGAAGSNTIASYLPSVCGEHRMIIVTSAVAIGAIIHIGLDYGLHKLMGKEHWLESLFFSQGQQDYTGEY